MQEMWFNYSEEIEQLKSQFQQHSQSQRVSDTEADVNLQRDSAEQAELQFATGYSCGEISMFFDSV